ncbi:MAG TPA: deoxyribose-phosphate aldolase [Bacteroidales bacterium]|nr:deoxyribose-phosphate aldolase [Bacteroidales bacterium]
MYSFKKYDQNQESIAKRIEAARQINPDQAEELKALKIILNCIDLTTLEGSDTEEKVLGLCNKAKSIHSLGADFPDVAAVCFYPTFAALAKKNLKDTNIEVACVAGAFPAGQSPIEIKVAEVEFAVVQGADEIDMVISRGKFLEGKFTEVADEIKAIKKACGDAHLKVILETGELNTVDNIRKASEIAINAGADFIKTSTGKIQPAATLEAIMVMADTVKEYFEATGKKIGLKPAGGISDYKTALDFYQVIKQTLGQQWLNNQLFRIGASRLTDDVIERLKQIG